MCGMAAAPLFPMNLNDVTLTKWDRKFINAFSTVYKSLSTVYKMSSIAVHVSHLSFLPPIDDLLLDHLSFSFIFP